MTISMMEQMRNTFSLTRLLTNGRDVSIDEFHRQHNLVSYRWRIYGAVLVSGRNILDNDYHWYSCGKTMLQNRNSLPVSVWKICFESCGRYWKFSAKPFVDLFYRSAIGSCRDDNRCEFMLYNSWYSFWKATFQNCKVIVDSFWFNGCMKMNGGDSAW